MSDLPCCCCVRAYWALPGRSLAGIARAASQVTGIRWGKEILENRIKPEMDVNTIRMYGLPSASLINARLQ